MTYGDLWRKPTTRGDGDANLSGWMRSSEFPMLYDAAELSYKRGRMGGIFPPDTPANIFPLTRVPAQSVYPPHGPNTPTSFWYAFGAPFQRIKGQNEGY